MTSGSTRCRAGLQEIPRVVRHEASRITRSLLRTRHTGWHRSASKIGRCLRVLGLRFVHVVLWAPAAPVHAQVQFLSVTTDAHVLHMGRTVITGTVSHGGSARSWTRLKNKNCLPTCRVLHECAMRKTRHCLKPSTLKSPPERWTSNNPGQPEPSVVAPAVPYILTPAATVALASRHARAAG